MMNVFSKKLFLLMTSIVIVAGVAFANPNPDDVGNPLGTLDADEIEYDTGTGIIIATGNVRMLRDNSTITGDRATYNSRTNEGVVEGNVVAVREDMRLQAARVTAVGDANLSATGSVVLVQADKTFRGEKVDYYPQREGYIVIEQGGRVESVDGVFSADYIEGWIPQMRYAGVGNAYINSPVRNVEGGADRMDYYGGTAERKRVILTGNAWLVQDNNRAKGNIMTVYLADEQLVQE